MSNLHQNVKDSKRHILITPALMWLIILAGIAVVIWVNMPNKQFFKPNTITYLISAVFYAYWVYFFLGAVFVNKYAPRSVKGVEKIVDRGVYRYVRHPIYSGDVLLGIGIFLQFPTLKVLLAVIWAILWFIVWMKIEERYLEDKFGDLYREYKKKTSFIFPKFTSKDKERDTSSEDN